jgi:hypothetical protein
VSSAPGRPGSGRSGISPGGWEEWNERKPTLGEAGAGFATPLYDKGIAAPALFL